MKRLLPLLFLPFLLLPLGCNPTDDPVDKPDNEENASLYYYANLFAFNIMRTYYLWVDEVSDEMADWTYGTDPVEKVKAVRYKDSSGEPVDKWTQLLPDYRSFLGSITGNTLSFGFEFVLYYADSSKKKVCMVVKYTYEDSPAREAGLKRGDVIFTLDGEEMTVDNYSTLITEKIYEGTTVKLGLSQGGSLSLTARQMYENPVQTVRTLNADGKAIGYLHFTGFTMDACRDLETAFRGFCQDGIEELVLDLRYNGGGYSLTGSVLGSMLAPPEVVSAQSVFNMDVYNSTLSKQMEEEDYISRFAPEFEITSGDDTFTVHPAQVNPGIKKLWVIVSDNTASASEALICGLKPYMDVTLVGEQTYGKFCGGYLILAKNWFQSLAKQKDADIDCDEALSLTEDWGIYVIASRYSDCNGVTLSMPSGIPADYEAPDNPLDGYELGDPSETILATVLALSSGKVTKAPAAGPALHPAPPVRRAGFGTLLYPSPACGN